jgi:hypothetical protein
MTEEIKTLHSDANKNIFYLSLIAILFSFAAFGIVGFKGSSSPQLQIVIVDMNKLLLQKAYALVHKGDSPLTEEKKAMEIQEHARKIKANIENYANANHVIVAVKGTLFGADVKEVTDDISALL